MYSKTLLQCATLICLSAASATAGIINDSDFESPAPNQYFTGAIGDGWNVTSGSISIINNSQGYGFAYNGLQYADLDPGGAVNTLSQTILGTVPGQAYTVSFYLSDDVGGDPVTVMFGATTLLNITTDKIGSGIYNFYTFNASATTTSTDLTFTSQYLSPSRTGGVGAVIDTVSVTGPVSTSTPEPATLGLTAIALALLGAIRKRS